MDNTIKKAADSRDIDKLRFIFIDSLDVDPTFEKYKEDFEYCKNIPGLFVSHKELSPFLSDKNKWNEDYWFKIKTDMEENFSIERFNHMRDVAKVFYADKIKRLFAERTVKNETKAQPAATPAATVSSPNTFASEIKQPESKPVSSEGKTYERVVKRYSEPKNTQLNQGVNNRQSTQDNAMGGGSTKKVMWGALAIVAVMAIIILVLILK